MKKAVFFFLCLISLPVFAQEMNQMRVVGKGEYRPDKIVTSSRIDRSGRVCSCIMIVSDLEGILDITANNGVVSRDHSPGTDLLFVSPDERFLTIKKDGYLPLEIILYEYDITLVSGQTWRLKLTGDKKLDLIPVSIDVDKENVSVYIEGKFEGTGKTYQLSAGSHELRLEKSGYKTISQAIDVSTKNILFRFNMTETDPLLIKFQSNPEGAEIYLDNANIGQTNKDKFVYEGKHALKLMKSGYLDIQKDIDVKETASNIFKFALVKNAVVLSLRVVPSDARILINKEDYSGKTEIELPPGRYKFEISMDGYLAVTDVIDLELGKPVTKDFTLRKITGKLQLTVSPTDADVELLKGDKIIEQWKGSKQFQSLQVGTYTLKAKANGYKAYTKDITIAESQKALEDVTLEKGSEIGKNMVFVKGGYFMMGSNDGEADEKPIHKIWVDDFNIGKYEVTQKEWQEVMGSNPSYYRGEDLPVDQVSWNDVQDYLSKLNAKTGKKYRLPTEAEWEYAARGGNKSRGYEYSGSNNIEEAAWYNGNSGSKTHPAGTKKPNELGLYDMTGNVWEWCSDWYDENYYKNSPDRNPQGGKGSSRLLRGGSWDNSDYNCRVSVRSSNSPGSNDKVLLVFV